MRDNRGQTLIELLLAFAISAVVLAALSYILFTGLRLYDRNDVNAKVQNETQNVSNLLKDSVMEAQGVCLIPGASGAEQCVLLGDLVTESQAGGYSAFFAGAAVVTQLTDGAGNEVGEIYLVSFPNADYADSYTKDGRGYAKLTDGAASEAAAAEAAMAEALSYLTGLSLEERRPWLLGSHVTGFEMHLADSGSLSKETVTYEDGTTEDRFYFEEPFGLRWNLSLTVQAQQETSTRTVEDTVYFRNRLPCVYVKQDGAMHGYLPK